MIVIQHRKQAEITHHLRRQELADKALILEVAHREMERLQPVGPGDIREPVFILFRRVLTDTLDVLEHGKAQRIRVNAAVPRAVVRRLEYHVGVAVQELQHKAFCHFAFVIQVIKDGVVPEGRPAFVHHLSLFLRIEVLAHLTHDAQDLTLPRLQQRGVLLHKVEQVLLRLGRVAARFHNRFLFFTFRQGTPQRIHLALQILFAAFLPGFLLLQGDLLRTFVAIHAVVHQRMAGVQQLFDLIHAVALFTLGDVVTGKDQVVDNRTGIGPAAEQVVIFEKRVMSVAGVGHH